MDVGWIPSLVTWLSVQMRGLNSTYWVIRLFWSTFTRLSVQKVQFEP